MHVPALGTRGEGWVALQTLVFGILVTCGILGTGWPRGVESPLRAVGIALEVCGAVLVVLGARRLGSAFTPFPLPRERAGLRRTGIYGRVRHPVYGGIIVFALGLSLVRSPLALVPTALLFGLFELKSRREELWLLERYPEYADYRSATPRRFIPWVLWVGHPSMRQLWIAVALATGAGTAVVIHARKNKIKYPSIWATAVLLFLAIALPLYLFQVWRVRKARALS
jgi:protein-S-isoprenylcysteine O-methyltransferase Ste14